MNNAQCASFIHPQVQMSSRKPFLQCLSETQKGVRSAEAAPIPPRPENAQENPLEEAESSHSTRSDTERHSFKEL